MICYLLQDDYDMKPNRAAFAGWPIPFTGLLFRVVRSFGNVTVSFKKPEEQFRYLFAAMFASYASEERGAGFALHGLQGLKYGPLTWPLACFAVFSSRG